MTESINKLRILVAKAIQSDNKGIGYFTNEQGLTEFLSIILEADQEEAAQVAKEILQDRDGAGYYYFETDVGLGGAEILAGLLDSIGSRNQSNGQL